MHEVKDLCFPTHLYLRYVMISDVFRVRDAAESLNVCLMKLVEEQDDPPSPVSDLSGDPSLEEPFNLCSGSSANDVPE